MSNSSVWDSFETYGTNVILPNHNNMPLFARWLNNLRDMETQANCDKNGYPIPDSNKFEKDGQTWGPIRWPYKSATLDASYSDPPMTFLLEDHLLAIGSTGWDWRNKKSRWLGFDFDSISGHAEGVGITDQQLAAIVARAPEWVEVIRSTRGEGRHLYIYFQEPFPTTNTHTEHAALARAFLPILSAASGLEFDTSVDACGSVLWIYHKNATRENGGYSIIRPATKILTDHDTPVNWQDHIEVCNGGRNKVRVRGWFEETETEGDELDEMTQAHATVKLDEDHHRVLDALQSTGYTCLWVNDHNLVQTHTAALKRVFNTFEEEGRPLKGMFDTNTPGGDAGKPNCFLRPKPNGAWDVYRFGQGTNEHPCWDKQGTWTHTVFNYPATLAQICRAAGGFEAPDQKQGYIFNDLDSLLKALGFLRSKLTLPDKAQEGRIYSLRTRNDGKVVVHFTKSKGDDAADFPGWAKAPRGWEKLANEPNKCTDKEQEDDNVNSSLDDVVRMLKCVSYEELGSMGGSFDGWVLKDSTDMWVKHPRENVAVFLQAKGYESADIPGILGSAILRSWSVVNEPFQPEFPGGRVWNLGASQYVFTPLDLAEGETPHHPNWDRVMRHCGSDLDTYIPHLPWCKEWGIYNGGDYLTAWIACMLRYPFAKLPYLFMYGPQNSGKSIFHEAISKLVTRGVMKADRALTSSSGFNGELLNVILGVIDEVDISKSGSAAYNKLKEWVTALTLSVHAKYKQVYEARSSLHFVQMANTRSSLPVMPGDTRITAMHVPPLLEEIPKEILIPNMLIEGPAYMRTLMDWNIPSALGRLKLPVIETQGKEEAMACNRNVLEAFIEEQCYKIPGAVMTLQDFHAAFIDTLDELEKSEWSMHELKKALKEWFPIGRRNKNQLYIGNLSMTRVEPSEEFILEDGRIKRRGSEND